MSTKTLKKAWLEYVSSGVDPKESIRPVIYESWQRCHTLNVDPWQKSPARILSKEELDKLHEKHHYFIEVSSSYMETLFYFVKDSGFVIALTDSQGILLKIIGDADVRNQIKSGGFVEGADYSEVSVGTNAIGTSLYLGQPLQVYSYEHFCRCAQVSSCSSAVIAGTENEVIGSICLVGYDYNVHSHTLGIAVSVAEAIHNSLVLMRIQQAFVVSDAYKTTIMNCISQGVLAVNCDYSFTHLNQKALRLLSLDPTKDYIGPSIQHVLPKENPMLKKIIDEGLRLTDHEVTINTTRGPTLFTVTTRAIRTQDGRYAGIVIMLDEIKRVRKIMQRVSGAVATTTFDDLVGTSQQYLETIDVAKNAALSDFSVLLLGESGTGKDVFAQAIHNYSNRKQGPFVAINCGAIPRELIGSELFGYEEGAYTGARKGGSTGKFELADGGTIFLDEIGDMPLEMQGHLLRVVEERKITRIGGHDLIPVDVRIIAATNRNLFEDITAGRFRQDLYYRLNVISIRMVPLRDRLVDLPVLVSRFYKKLVLGLGLEEKTIPPEFIDTLLEYPFPGNIRELQNIIERTLILSNDGALEVSNLPVEVRQPSLLLSNSQTTRSVSNKYANNSEKEKIHSLLIINNGNISKTARDLGIARSTLYRKLSKYGIHSKIICS